MPTVTFDTGVVNDSADVLVNCMNPIYPFLFAHGQHLKKYEVGAGKDFASGDDIVINFEGSTKLHFWIALSNVGAIKEGAEADIGGGVVGRKLTFSNVTTDLHVWVVYDI